MLTCIIIGGALWISDPVSDTMIAPAFVTKEPNEEIVYYGHSGATIGFQASVSQHQVRMGTEEFISDCVHGGYSIPEQEFFIPDSIDSGERTGVGDR